MAAGTVLIVLIIFQVPGIVLTGQDGSWFRLEGVGTGYESEGIQQPHSLEEKLCRSPEVRHFTRCCESMGSSMMLWSSGLMFDGTCNEMF